MFPHNRSPSVIVEFEDKYCKAGEIFERMMQRLEEDCEKGVPIHEAEEHLWQRVLQMGREMLAAFVGEQDANTPKARSYDDCRRGVCGSTTRFSGRSSSSVMFTRREKRSDKRTFRLMRSWACRRERFRIFCSDGATRRASIIRMPKHAGRCLRFLVSHRRWARWKMPHRVLRSLRTHFSTASHRSIWRRKKRSWLQQAIARACLCVR